MKNTMDSRDISRFNKLLKEPEMTIEMASKILKIEAKTLEKFTPEYIAEVKAKREKEEAKTEEQVNEEAANAVLAAAKKVSKDKVSKTLKAE